MRIVKIAHSSPAPATARPALSRQPVPRAKARVLTIPRASISDFEPLVLPAAVLGAGGLALALARTTNQLNALRAQQITPKNVHKTPPLAPEPSEIPKAPDPQKTDWTELAKWAGPAAALLIFSFNQTIQIGGLAARQDAFKDSLGLIRSDMKESFGLIRDDLKRFERRLDALDSKIDGLDSKIDTLGQEVATLKGIKIGQERASSDPSS